MGEIYPDNFRERLKHNLGVQYMRLGVKETLWSNSSSKTNVLGSHKDLAY